MTPVLDDEGASAFNEAVADAERNLAQKSMLSWPKVEAGQEVKVGVFGVMFKLADRTLSILGSPLYKLGLLERLAKIVNGEKKDKK